MLVPAPVYRDRHAGILQARTRRTTRSSGAKAFFSGVVKMIRALQEQGLVPLSGMCVTCTHFRPNVRAGASPHYCAFVDAPLATEQLRLDCPEHELAAEAARRDLWERFMRPA
ncbi:hypothetical protein WME99_51570 [Sorangium sp. So ce136]|uniref:hypothetical protein n=1 Tax=Sorangium sp. So ce136 TaxID=3133284 RepID=UPI003F004E9E